MDVAVDWGIPHILREVSRSERVWFHHLGDTSPLGKEEDSYHSPEARKTGGAWVGVEGTGVGGGSEGPGPSLQCQCSYFRREAHRVFPSSESEIRI